MVRYMICCINALHSALHSALVRYMRYIVRLHRFVTWGSHAALQLDMYEISYIIRRNELESRIMFDFSYIFARIDSIVLDYIRFFIHIT